MSLVLFRMFLLQKRTETTTLRSWVSISEKLGRLPAQRKTCIFEAIASLLNEDLQEKNSLRKKIASILEDHSCTQKRTVDAKNKAVWDKTWTDHEHNWNLNKIVWNRLCNIFKTVFEKNKIMKAALAFRLYQESTSLCLVRTTNELLKTRAAAFNKFGSEFVLCHSAVPLKAIISDTPQTQKVKLQFCFRDVQMTWIKPLTFHIRPTQI